MSKVEEVRAQVGTSRAIVTEERVSLVWCGFPDTNTTHFKGSTSAVRERLRDAIKALDLTDKAMQVEPDSRG